MRKKRSYPRKGSLLEPSLLAPNLACFKSCLLLGLGRASTNPEWGHKVSSDREASNWGALSSPVFWSCLCLTLTPQHPTPTPRTHPAAKT